MHDRHIERVLHVCPFPETKEIADMSQPSHARVGTFDRLVAAIVPAGLASDVDDVLAEASDR